MEAETRRWSDFIFGWTVIFRTSLRYIQEFINRFLAYDTRSGLGMYFLKITSCFSLKRLSISFRAIIYVKTSIFIKVYR